MNRWKNGNSKFNDEHGNPNGSVKSNIFPHVQRIGSETDLSEYNLPTSHRHLEQVIRYAELMGNYKNQGIKSLWDNMMDIVYDFKLFDDTRLVEISG